MFGRIEIKMDDRAPYSFFFSFFLVVAVPRFDFKYESKLCSSRSILSYGIWNLEQSFHFLWNDWEWSREDLVLYRVKQKYCDLLQIEAKNSDRCWSCYVHIKVWKPWWMFFCHSDFMWNQVWPFYSYKNCHLGCF